MKLNKALSSKMKEYRKLRIRLENLENEIRLAVADRKETTEVNGLTVKFAKPRRNFDYKGACDTYEIPVKLLERFTTTVEKVDWKGLAAEIDVDEDEMEDFTSFADNPSVSFSITELIQ